MSALVLPSLRGIAMRTLTVMSVLALGASAVHAQLITESPEIVYSSVEAQSLYEKANELGSAVAIYEHVHNNFEYAPYHGSRSGSVNTFLGQRGNDVDIATALIAMLRSQGIPARYAVGTVRMPAAQLTNWLGAENFAVAAQVLQDYGTQRLVVSQASVDFEHTWVEAFVPFDQYRGIDAVNPAVDCSQSANFSRCTWVAIDASFKQKTYNASPDIYGFSALNFNYTDYYRAILDNDEDLRDKNPLTIQEDKTSVWLRDNLPGTTIHDLEDTGRIVELREGLLPASLPYLVVSAIRRYDTVAAHDAAVPAVELKKWGKTVRVGVKAQVMGEDGPEIIIDEPGTPLLLAEVNTRRLVVSTEFVPPGDLPNVVVRLGETEISRPILSDSFPDHVLTPGDPFLIVVSMDGQPGIGGNPDTIITADYTAVVGGYYLVATGGESSNWSQVHRAADQLLAATGDYSIVFNPGETNCLSGGMNCTPYVDANGNGWDVSDTPLLQHQEAMDRMTGGLLYVAATQYYARLREHFERAGRLMKVRTPILGFLGVVSSLDEVEYIDGTAFSVLPGGLLIDMKGVTVGGSYRAEGASAVRSSRHFELLGHILSSLEHEIWQELTGYDAVSTVRGIQMALAGNAMLLSVKRDGATDTLPAFFSEMGFFSTSWGAFSPRERVVFGTQPTTWFHSNPVVPPTAGFDALKQSLSGANDPRIDPWRYYNDGWDSIIACVDEGEDFLANNDPPVLSNVCGLGLSWPAGTARNVALAQLRSAFLTWADSPKFFYFDRAQGFVLADFLFRNMNIASSAYSTQFVTKIRDNVLLNSVSGNGVEYLMPSRLVTGSTYRFEVDIGKVYQVSTGQIHSLYFEIVNRSVSAGGGYVGLEAMAPGEDAGITEQED